MRGTRQEICLVQRDEVALGRGHLLLPATAGAKALAHAVGTAPVGVLFYRAEIYIVEVLQTKAAKVLVARDLETLLHVVPPLFVFN